jgi:hypothetical protein
MQIAPKEYHVIMSWYNAVVYCQFLDIDGVTGWRLPTAEEVINISIDDIILTETPLASYIWSSTEKPYDSEVVTTYNPWIEDHYLPSKRHIGGLRKSVSYTNLVVPVRTICEISQI